MSRLLQSHHHARARGRNDLEKVVTHSFRLRAMFARSERTQLAHSFAHRPFMRLRSYRKSSWMKRCFLMRAARPRRGERAVVAPYHSALGLVRNVEVRWKARACTCDAARSMCRIVRPDFSRRSRQWLLPFGFERIV